MPDFAECRSTLLGYVKARIPFVAVRTSERDRLVRMLRGIADEVGVPVYVHTMTQGIRDVSTGRTLSEERTVAGALDWICDQFAQRVHVTLILTDVSEVGDDTPVARQLRDAAMLASERSGMLGVIADDPVWAPLQRLGMAVTLDPPTEDEMVEVIRSAIDPYRQTITIEWDDDDIRRAASVLAGVTQLQAQNVIATLLTERAITREHLAALGRHKDRIFSDVSGIERVRVDSADAQLGGLSGLRSWLARERELLTADLRARGLRPPRGILLVGVPGCGKSLSAKFTAASWQLPLYRLDLSNIHGMYLGQSEARLREALTAADRVAPCVLWIDEVEKGLAGAMAASDGGASARLVGHFLFWLQESRARVFVVATANDVSRLPSELLRRGRFDELFFVDLPAPDERDEIVRIYVERNLRVPADQVPFDELVRRSEGFSGADIEAAVRDVAKVAVLHGDDAVDEQTWLDAFDRVVPLSRTSPEQIDAIRAWGRERAAPASAGRREALPEGRQRTVLV